MVTGLGDYCGTLTLEFAITKRNLTEAAVLVDPQRYTGSALTPKPTSVTILKRDGTTPLDLIEGLDYELSYRDNVGPGAATMVLTALEDSNLTGTIEVPFVIVKEEQARREEERVPQQAASSTGSKGAGGTQGGATSSQQVGGQLIRTSRSLPKTSDATTLPLVALAVAGVALVLLGLMHKDGSRPLSERHQG